MRLYIIISLLFISMVSSAQAAGPISKVNGNFSGQIDSKSSGVIEPFAPQSSPAPQVDNQSQAAQTGLREATRPVVPLNRNNNNAGTAPGLHNAGIGHSLHPVKSEIKTGDDPGIGEGLNAGIGSHGKSNGHGIGNSGGTESLGGKIGKGAKDFGSTGGSDDGLGGPGHKTDGKGLGVGGAVSEGKADGMKRRYGPGGLGRGDDSHDENGDRDGAGGSGGSDHENTDRDRDHQTGSGGSDSGSGGDSGETQDRNRDRDHQAGSGGSDSGSGGDSGETQDRNRDRDHQTGGGTGSSGSDDENGDRGNSSPTGRTVQDDSVGGGASHHGFGSGGTKSSAGDDGQNDGRGGSSTGAKQRGVSGIGGGTKGLTGGISGKSPEKGPGGIVLKK